MRWQAWFESHGAVNGWKELQNARVNTGASKHIVKPEPGGATIKSETQEVTYVD